MKTSFLLLSAGSSSRMGRDKAQLEFKGHPWLYEQVLQIQKSQVVDHLVVVCQSKRHSIYKVILQTLQGSAFQIEFVENDDKNSKPSDSIRKALRQSPFQRGAMISPIDVPLRPETVHKIYEARGSQSICRPAGHPVWMSSQKLEEFKNSKIERLDHFLGSQESETQFLDLKDESISMNLNDPDSWIRFSQRQEHRVERKIPGRDLPR